MANYNLPKEHQFPRHRQNHTQKHPNGYFLPKLNKLLNTAWQAKDKDVKQLLKDSKLEETYGIAVALRLFLNALEGDNKAIEMLLDRVDGKVPMPIQNIEADQALVNEEIEIVPSKPNGKLKQYQRFINQ